MSESSGPQTFNVDSFEGKWRTGSCGPLIPGAHLKIDKPNEDGEGEVSMLPWMTQNKEEWYIDFTRSVTMVATCSWDT